jgi:Iron-sulfur cluster assembly protein
VCPTDTASLRRARAWVTDEIVNALKTVYDPEIPADIYEIGLIYRIDIADDRTVKVDTGRRAGSRHRAKVAKAFMKTMIGSQFSNDMGPTTKRRGRAVAASS